MAIDITDPDHASRLSKALRQSYSDAAPQRTIRENLTDIYRDRSHQEYTFDTLDRNNDLGTILNLFQKFVRGHLLTLAYYSPKWAIRARTMAGNGLDDRMKAFMGAYCEILNFNKVQKQLALDSAFGWAVCKVTDGISPKGITAPVSPRMSRVDPNMFIVDPTAACIDECSYLADIFLVPLNEARAHPGFDPEKAAKIAEYRHTNTGKETVPNSDDKYAEPMARLIDVYIPKSGMIYTYECPDDEFRNIASGEPVGQRESKINPYALLSLTQMPGRMLEISKLYSFRGLHLVANEMLTKGINQARDSQRNPLGELGSEQDMSTALDAGDGNPIFMENKDKIGLFTIPGPDPSILNLGNAAAMQFSKEAGNLEVALGASAGADTAKQTEALIGQISASQSLDRSAFEEFLAEIGFKLMSLAFENEALELETRERVPGTTIEFSRYWVGPKKMPRMAKIDAFKFEVVPYSTSIRTPQEMVGQLNQASTMIMQWMQAKAQGAPIALEAVMKDIGESFDLLPNLQEWWNGQEPTPAEKTGQTYNSMAAPPEGSDIRYQGQGGQSNAEAPPPQQAGGVS